MNSISAFIRDMRDMIFLHAEDTARRWLFANQEEGAHEAELAKTNDSHICWLAYQDIIMVNQLEETDPIEPGYSLNMASFLLTKAIVSPCQRGGVLCFWKWDTWQTVL